MSSTVPWDLLQQAAVDARKRAYAPYSQYKVGAAILGNDGSIFSGCNVENISYGLSVCAERNAVFAGILAGMQEIKAAMVVSAGKQTASPCGACRQVFAEFASDFPIRCISEHGDALKTTLGQLLPHAFGRKALER